MRLRTLEQHRKIYALFGTLKMHEEAQKEVIRSFSGERTASSRELLMSEAHELIQWLQKQAGIPEDSRDKQRKAIIAIFKRKGHTVQEAVKWAENKGVNGTKKPFSDYTGQELYKLTIAAENGQ